MGCSGTIGRIDTPAESLRIDAPVVELPVLDVRRAQAHYADALGFEVAWLWGDESIGAVRYGDDVAIFLSRREPPFDTVSLWVFALDVDAKHAELTRRGAHIVSPLEVTPWNLRQFTVEDLDGHRLHFHHDV